MSFLLHSDKGSRQLGNEMGSNLGCLATRRFNTFALRGHWSSLTYWKNVKSYVVFIGALTYPLLQLLKADREYMGVHHGICATFMSV